MDIPISAGSELDDIARRVEAGEEVVLTRDGKPVASLTPVVEDKIDIEARRAKLQSYLGIASDDRELWPDAAHSADFLYDADGMPR